MDITGHVADSANPFLLRLEVVDTVNVRLNAMSLAQSSQSTLDKSHQPAANNGRRSLSSRGKKGPLFNTGIVVLLLPVNLLRAGIVLGDICLCIWLSVCLYVCLFVCTKSRKLLIENWCKLVRICPVVNARSGWKLVTFDLDLWSWELVWYFSFYIWSVIRRFEGTFSQYLNHLRVARSWG